MTLTFRLHEVACLRVKYVTGSLTIVSYYIGGTSLGYVLYGQVSTLAYT